MATNRSRTKAGTFREIRKDTKIGTIEKRYDVKLGVRSDMKLETYLRKVGQPSLARMLRDSK